LPTTPWAKNAEGRGPAWSNSLFEDNAEFGLGFRLSIDKQTEFARELVLRLGSQIGDELAAAILSTTQKDESDIYEQRQRVSLLKERLNAIPSAEADNSLLWPTCSSRKACGLSEGTVGPMTSAMAASIT
jgi:pyruvate-ferredoxin/flavodoxin oxidoreductase